MVRIYDPTTTDPSLFLLNAIKEVVYRKSHTLRSSELKKAISSFLDTKQYDKMLKDYTKAEKPFPDIILKGDCSYEHFFFQRNNFNFNDFKGSFDIKLNRIYLCSNFILNLLELKENLDRELVLAYDINVKALDYKKDGEMACSMIRSCRAELENYKWNEELTKEMTRICAKNLLKKRGYNEEKLPFDSWVRYSSMMIDNSMSCFYDICPFN